MAATIYEVAALAGVSPATVSRVLNGAAVSPAYAARVREAADSLNFRPNRTARTLRRRSSEIIALVIPDIENPFFTALSRGVEDRAISAGYSVVLCNTDEMPAKEARYLDIALSEHMAGIILAPASASTNLDAVVGRGTPVVTVDRSAPGYPVDAVLLDNEDAARRATTMLYEQGFRRVACITGPRGIQTADERAAGWRTVFTERTPGAKPSTYLRHGDYRTKGGRAAMASLLRLARPPDAVVVCNNLMTVGAMQHLAEVGQPPPQVGLASLGELPFPTWADVPVTVLSWPTRRLGMIAADLLLARIRGDKRAAQTVVVPTGYDEPGRTEVGS